MLRCGPQVLQEQVHTHPGRPLSRSYGALLPSSLAEVRPNALGRLSLPTSVGLRYGRHFPITARLFLSVWDQQNFHPPKRIDFLISQLVRRNGFAYPGLAYILGRTMSNGHAPSTLPHPPSALKRQNGGVGILTYCPSSSAFAYDLGPTNPTPINVA